MAPSPFIPQISFMIAVTVAAASGLHLQPRSPPTRAFPAMTAFRNTDEPVMPRNGSFRTIWRAPPPTSLHSPLPRRRSSNGTRDALRSTSATTRRLSPTLHSFVTLRLERRPALSAGICRGWQNSCRCGPTRWTQSSAGSTRCATRAPNSTMLPTSRPPRQRRAS